MKSELAWTLSDYQAAGHDAPARIISNPELTEGEMMTAEEVEEFIKDSIATLRILADKKSPRYDAVLGEYRADLAYLVAVGSLGEEEHDALVEESNTRF